MAAGLRIPTAALAILSICLCVAVVGCASRTVHWFNENQNSNVWLLPVWPNHFDLRELYTVIGASAAILILNGVLVMSIFISALPANFIVFITTLLSTMVSTVAVVLPAVLNTHTATRDTLQTWTCRWSTATVGAGQGPPQQFGSICQETRFAFYAGIPIFVIQLLLLSITIIVLTTSGRRNGLSSRRPYEEEKSTSQHELSRVRQVSFEAKSESPNSMQMGNKSGVAFA